jgi:selenide,water dikinase
LAALPGVHAMTDVTGFGLAGHLLEICRASRLGAELRFEDLPLIDEAAELVKDGVATGASTRNWASYGDAVQWAAEAPEWQRKLITDPQTSGGLLVACAPNAVDAVLQTVHAVQGTRAWVIGRLLAGAAGVRVS